MTRKTYTQLAKDLGEILASNDGDTVVAWQCIHSMCSAMKSDNSAFDKTRFIDAIEAERARLVKSWDDQALQNLTNSIVRGNG